MYNINRNFIHKILWMYGYLNILIEDESRLSCDKVLYASVLFHGNGTTNKVTMYVVACPSTFITINVKSIANT